MNTNRVVNWGEVKLLVEDLSKSVIALDVVIEVFDANSDEERNLLTVLSKNVNNKLENLKYTSSNGNRMSEQVENWEETKSLVEKLSKNVVALDVMIEYFDANSEQERELLSTLSKNVNISLEDLKSLHNN